jgi:hypothetical protein
MTYNEQPTARVGPRGRMEPMLVFTVVNQDLKELTK